MNKELNNIICSFINSIGTIPFESDIQREEHANKVANAILDIKDNGNLAELWEYHPEEIESTANMIKKIYTKKR